MIEIPAKLLKQLEALQNIKATEGLVQALTKVQQDAVNLAPVDTGALSQSSNVSETGENEANLAFEVPYAGYVEFGTIKMSAQPFLRPAIEMNKSEIVKITGNVVQDNIRKELR